jgi:hypothetical protein
MTQHLRSSRTREMHGTTHLINAYSAEREQDRAICMEHVLPGVLSGSLMGAISNIRTPVNFLIQRRLRRGLRHQQPYPPVPCSYASKERGDPAAEAIYL